MAATEYWIPTSIVAVGLISLLCAVGWWHQRGLRELFKAEADSLDELDPPQMSTMTFTTIEAVRGGDKGRQQGPLVEKSAS